MLWRCGWKVGQGLISYVLRNLGAVNCHGFRKTSGCATGRLPVRPLKDHTKNNKYYILSALKRYKSCNTPGSFCTDKPQFYFSQPLLYFKMFARAASIFVLALPLLASATALPRQSTCDSGSTTCCETYEEVTVSII